jgi:hypothetical protein
MTRCAGKAQHKEHGHTGPTFEQRQQKNQTRNKVAKGTSTGRTFRKKNRAQPECSNGTRDRDLKEQLCLGSERTSGRFFRKALVLEIMKQRVEPSVTI